MARHTVKVNIMYKVQCVAPFSVGAFLDKRARLLQWRVFFRQTTGLTLYVPRFSTDISCFRGNTTVVSSSLSSSQKLFRAFAKPDETEQSPPFNIFFSTMRRFFESCFMSPNGPPSIFCRKLEFQRFSPFLFSAL